jgi:acetyl esterase/lipase
MPLDPQMQKIVDATLALGLPPIERMTVEQARESIRQRTPALGPVQQVKTVEEHHVPVADGTIGVRLYRPSPTRPLPALVFYHGGGWVIGDLYTHDGICRAIANAAECVVASVDYRLAPERKYPAAFEDSYAALTWLAGHAPTLGVDPARLAVGGDSAGGNLAAAAALAARDRQGPRLALQLLIYPVTAHAFDTASYRENGEGYMLTREGMKWFWNHYLARPEDGQQPYASPLLARNLGGLAPALVITAEYDPLRDEGEAYAKRLAEAGVPVTITRYPGLVHGFIRMINVLDPAKRALDEVAAALRKAFA